MLERKEVDVEMFGLKGRKGVVRDRSGFDAFDALYKYCKEYRF
jgi:hypothetical protein